MANHKSALKEHRQALKRRQRNRRNKARMRTAVKSFRKLVESDPTAAASALPATCAMIDRTVTLGAIHDNAAARTKSRLTRALAAKTSA